MSKIQKIQIIILFFAFCFLFSYNSAKAAKLELISEIQEIGVNQQFQVDLVLDTENEEINAIEGKILFPEDLLELKEIKDGNSIVSFWIERPRVSRQTDAKQERETDALIVFSGIVPGGYNDAKGLIFSAVFQAKKEGAGTIEIQDAKALLNDGKGTPAKLSVSNFQFLISKEVAPLELLEIKDTEPPELFKPMIAQDPKMFEGKYFLVFATQDKKSGIAHYEVQENRRQKIESRKWIETESPYILKDQELRSYIFVKAVDKAGNERIAVVEPRYPIKWYEMYEIWGIIIVMIFIGYIFWKILKSKIKYQKSK